MCKLKGGIDKGGHYDVEMTAWMQKGGIIRSKLKGQMDKGVYYTKSGQFDSQIKREDG